MNNFRLIALKTNNKINRNLDVLFLDKENFDSETNEIFTSLVIGNNGAGKSYILSIITSIFRYLEGIKEEKKIPEMKHFKIEYMLNGNHFEINYIEKKTYIKNYKEVTIKEVELPKRLLGSSFSVNDKFIYSDNSTESLYKYLGVRGSESGTGTKTHQKKIGESLINLSADKEKYKYVKSIFDFLGYKPKIQLKYKLRNINYFFKNDLSLEEFNNYFANWRERSKRKTEPFYYKHYNDMKNNKEIENVYEFLHNTKINRMKKNEFIYDISFDSQSEQSDIVEEFKYLKKLMNLDLISSPEIELIKDGSFSLENASSGEFHFLFNLINILSQIEQNSLILVDEPEISLHPEWQCRYVNILHTILSNYKSCHLIIASHSHFLASDLPIKSSTITRVTNDNKLITGEIYDYSTYGWSIENILYNVFNTKTSRNYYLERDIEKLLKMLSDIDSNKEELKYIVSKIEKLNIPTNDPLNELIDKVRGSLL